MNRLPPAVVNGLALTYLFTAYSFGISLLIQEAWILNLVGVLLVIHALVLSTAFTHEFIHGTIFKERALNTFFGKLMTHINGACYAPYEDLVDHHFNHHIHHADFVPFDIPTYVKELPPLIRQVFIALEWLYFPAFEFVLRGRIILAPFRNPDKRNQGGRTLGLLAYRITLFAVLGWLSWKALLIYALAYTCFVNLIRFVDAFHHIYDYVVVGQSFPKRDRVYEQEHTFSNLVSTSHPWLNLLYLNFSYHNAHHHDMRCPWYELPELQQRLYGEANKNIMPLPQLVANYHRFRLQRLFGGQGQETLEKEASAIASLTGGVGVSLLTPP